MSTEKADCPVCGQTAAPAAEVPGRVPPIRTFAIFHCPNCRFSFIASPRTDYETIYSPDYYQGLGADPMVHYLYDHLYPDETLRRYEWQGLVTVFRSLVKSPEQAQWLDYGCGLGSLVRWGRRAGVNISGFDPYAQSEPAREMTEEEKLWKPHLLSPAELAGRTFDFVTSIEVIEHTADPLNFLKSIRPLLKPGGILFLTTGNARPFRGKLEKWSYTSSPDVHISFFEPQTLGLALEKTGFRPQYAGLIPGLGQVIKYKILKNLGFVRHSPLFSLWPWPLLVRLADARFQVSAMPLGVAPDPEPPESEAPETEAAVRRA